MDVSLEAVYVVLFQTKVSCHESEVSTLSDWVEADT